MAVNRLYDGFIHMLHDVDTVLPVYLLELGVGHDSVAIWSGVVFSITFL